MPIIPGDNDGPVPGDPGVVQPVASPTGGAHSHSFISDGGQAAAPEKIKEHTTDATLSSPGVVYDIDAFNIGATPAYLKLYDQAAEPDETDTPYRRMLIPGSSSGDGSGFVKAYPQGLQFHFGIWARLTTGIADNDTGEVTASEVLVNVSAI